MKHWYYSDWNEREEAATDMTESDVSPRRTQSAVGRQGQDSWTRAQTTLSTFDDGRSTTLRGTADVEDPSQSTAARGARRPSCTSDRWIAVSDSADPGRGCYVVAVHSDRDAADPATVGEQCRCQSRARLVGVDFDNDAGVSGTTSKNASRTVPGSESPHPAALRTKCTDLVDCSSSSSLNRKPKMVVKPNCDQAAVTPAALRSYDTTSGIRQTGSASLEHGDDNPVNPDCCTDVPDGVHSSTSVATFNLARTSTLPSRCNRSTSTTPAAASLQRPSNVADTRATYAPRLFFTDAGGAMAHGSAAVYRAGSYHNGFIGDSEKSAINRSCAAAPPTSYGCGRDQIDRRISTSGVAGGTDIKVVDRRRRNACSSSSDGWISRLVVSTLTSFVVGCLVFLAARCHLGCSLPVAASVAAGASMALFVTLVASRRCRCVVALALPAVSTDRGRVGVVMVTVGTLLCGPTVNVKFNIREMARSMTCSADIAYNQTVLLLQVMRQPANT